TTSAPSAPRPGCWEENVRSPGQDVSSPRRQRRSRMFVEIDVARDHNVGGELLLGPAPTGCAIDRAELAHGVAALLDRSDQEAVDARPHDLRQGPARAG